MYSDIQNLLDGEGLPIVWKESSKFRVTSPDFIPSFKGKLKNEAAHEREFSKEKSDI